MHWNTFAFLIFPYVAISVFALGLIYRFLRDPYHWNSGSSEMLEKRQIKWASFIWHYAILGSLGGHMIGLWLPERVWEFFHIGRDLHLALADGFGIAFATGAWLGLALFLWRRLTVKRVFEVTTLTTFAVLLILAWVVGFGAYQVYVARYDYLDSIAPWARGIVTFTAEPEQMSKVPFFYKVHILSALVAFAVTPFTRLVHIFTVPFPYALRPYIPFRRRSPVKASMKARA
jgi:nitrate reductase gamma subunit